MPIKLAPWDIHIIETTWPPGEHTEGMFFEVTDIDKKEYTVNDHSNKKRLKAGDDPLQEFPRAH